MSTSVIATSPVKVVITDTSNTIGTLTTTNASSTTFLRGDGTWVTPTDTNTTYDLTSTGTTTASINLVPSSGATDSVTITGSGATSVSHSAGAITISSTDTNTFPTTWTWTDGTTSGPTASITGTSSAISVAAIPAASATVSGIVTTGNQTIAGAKTFSGTVGIDILNVGGGTGATGATISSAGAVTADGSISTGASLGRSALAGGGATGATFDNSGNLIRTTSSARYKQDIEQASYLYNDVLALEPKMFRLKSEVSEDENARTYAGFIAEEVDQIESLKVFVNYLTQPDGSKIPDGIQYGEMVSALVSAIKHQDNLINAITARIEALENR